MSVHEARNMILATAVIVISIIVMTMGILVVSFAGEEQDKAMSSENAGPEGTVEKVILAAQEDTFKDIAKAMKKNTRGTIKANREASASREGDQAEILRQRQEAARYAAVDWAITIAEDDSFHYGRSKWAHHNGCYFCGSNQEKGSIKRKEGASKEECERTYCCNPFITAAYMHGAGAKEVDCRVPDKRFGLSRDKNKVLKNKDAFQKINKPSDPEQLEPGDILLAPAHAMLYIGDGAIAEAAHADDGEVNGYWDDSIRCKPISDKQWDSVELIYRYIGTGAY